MPRRPTRRCQVHKPLPLTFSPFFRSITRFGSARLLKHHMHNSKSKGKSPCSSKENGLIPHSKKTKHETSESSEDEDFEGVVQADFAFFDPKPDDFHGVKTLLQAYLDDEQWDLSGFVDLILEQTTVGTVVKMEGDEDNGVFSLVTALNLGRYQDNKCIKELKEFVLKVCSEKDVKDKLRSLLGDQAHSVGLLVSQRVLNLPPQLLPPLYDALFDEISWATEDEPTKELQDSFRFKSYIIVSKIYENKNANQKKRVVGDNDDAIIYVKPEDELFHKRCSWSFSFPLHAQHLVPHELRNYQAMGFVMAIDSSKITIFQQELRSLIDES